MPRNRRRRSIGWRRRAGISRSRRGRNSRPSPQRRLGSFTARDPSLRWGDEQEIAMRFEGKSIIVTGAGSGIGRATARLFAGEGGQVIVAAQSEGADETAAMIERKSAEQGKSVTVGV